MSKKCNNCGVELPDNALFCPECGTKQAPLSNKCSQCGTSIPTEASFCPECGTPLIAKSTVTSPSAASGAFSLESLIKQKQQDYTAIQQKAIDEENKRLEEEKKRRAEEAKAQKEEEERLRLEAERKKEEERLRSEEEKKRKAEEAKAKKEEQERLRLEAERKKEEERLKLEGEKKRKTAQQPVQDSAQEEKTQIGAHMEYVDLGLSVKWAKWNLGATAPEEYGDYFAWGETEKYVFTDDRPYKFHVKGGGLTKYNTKETYGKVVDNIKQLELADDAAHRILGGGWRMPTMKEVDELKKFCSYIPATINGVKGVRMRSKKKGYTDKWIFFPAAGYAFYGKRSKVSSSRDCFYWTSSLYTRRPDSALTVFGNDAFEEKMDRETGLSIRPVIK